MKNTTNISEIYKESDIPIVIIKNDYIDMIIMSVKLYEQIITKMQEAILINETLNDYDQNSLGLDSFIKGIINK